MQVVTYRRQVTHRNHGPAIALHLPQHLTTRRDPEAVVLPRARVRKRSRDNDLQSTIPRRLLRRELGAELARAVRSGWLNAVHFLNRTRLPSVDIGGGSEQEQRLCFPARCGGGQGCRDLPPPPGANRPGQCWIAGGRPGERNRRKMNHSIHQLRETRAYGHVVREVEWHAGEVRNGRVA